MTKEAVNKKELAEMIMAAAIEKVLKLGFRMKVGSPGQSMLPEIKPGGLNIIYYFTGSGSDESNRVNGKINGIQTPI